MENSLKSLQLEFTYASLFSTQTSSFGALFCFFESLVLDLFGYLDSISIINSWLWWSAYEKIREDFSKFSSRLASKLKIIQIPRLFVVCRNFREEFCCVFFSSVFMGIFKSDLTRNELETERECSSTFHSLESCVSDGFWLRSWNGD